MTIILDEVLLDHVTFTDDGFLQATPIVTRTGVFPYRMQDGSIRHQLRSPQEVFNRASLDTMKLIPVTNEHPPQKKVTADTAKDLMVGSVGETIRDSAPYVYAKVVINDAKAIKDIKNGKKQLSLGYMADVVDEKGIFDGKEYDAVQKNIKYNHLAIVQKGRMGDKAAILVDGEDDVIMCVADNADNAYNDKCSDNNFTNQNQRGHKDMRKVIIDNIEYEAAPEVANALNKAEKTNEKLLNDNASLKSEIETLSAKVDTLNDENQKLKERDIEAEVQKAAEARISLLADVRDVFGDEVYEKNKKAANIDIKKAAIASYLNCDAKDFAEKSADYVDARFDATVDLIKKSKIGEQRKTVNNDSSETKDGGYAGFAKRIYKNKQ